MANATRADRRGKFVKMEEDEEDEGGGGGGDDVAGELCTVIIVVAVIPSLLQVLDLRMAAGASQ